LRNHPQRLKDLRQTRLTDDKPLPRLDAEHAANRRSTPQHPQQLERNLDALRGQDRDQLRPRMREAIDQHIHLHERPDPLIERRHRKIGRSALSTGWTFLVLVRRMKAHRLSDVA